MSFLKKITMFDLKFVLLIPAILLVACGGGGGTGSSSLEKNDAFMGSVVKGPVVNAVIEVRAINPVLGNVSEELLGASETGPDGAFSLELGAISGALLINSLGGSFVDESDQNNDGGDRRQVSFGPESGFSVYRPEDVNQISLTILTDAMTQRAFALAQESQISIDNAFDAVRKLTTDVIGFDPLTTRALNPLNPGSGATQQERQYALLLGGLAVAANELAIRVGLPHVNADVIAALVTDLADGNLDGLAGRSRGEGPPIAIMVNEVAMPNIDISAAILRFRNNNNAQYQGVVAPVVDEQALAASPQPSNTPPSVQIVSENLVLLEGASLQLTGLSLLATDAETSTNNLRYLLVQEPTSGLVTDGQRALNVGHVPAASLQYANQGFPQGGIDTIVVAVIDEDNGFILVPLTINVLPDEDGDGVFDEVDQCPASPVNELANAQGCTPSQLPLDLNGSFNVVGFGIGQAGPGTPENTMEQYSTARFRLEPYNYTLSGVDLTGAEGDEQDVSLNRFFGGGDIFVGSFNDCQQDPQGCLFSEALIRKDDVLFVPGFVDTNPSDFGEGDRVEFDAATRNVLVPVVSGNRAQALVGSEFVAHQSLPALDIDFDDQADPDLDDPEYASALEPLPGALGKSGEAFLSLALRAPAQQHSAADFAGGYGYIGYVQGAAQEEESEVPEYSASVDVYRADLAVDTGGVVSGTTNASTTVNSLGFGDVSVTTSVAAGLQLGSSLAPDAGGDPGEALLTLVFPDNDTIVLKGAMSEDASIGGFGFFESLPAQSEMPTDVEAEFGMALRRASAAVDMSNSERRVTMLGREFGCGFGSSVAAAQNAQILITSEVTEGCDSALGATTQCYDASFNAIDGHSYSEARQVRLEGTEFGELTLDGSASEGGFVPGAARVATGVVKVNDNGLFRLELFGEQQGVPEATYNGYINDNGTVIFEGGSEEIGGQGCDFANRFVGIAVEVLGPSANAGLDNQAPEIISVTPSEEFPILPEGSVTLSASATDNENDVLTYKWVVRAGSLSNADTSTVGWTAPDTSSGATVLELHVSDELNTSVELVEVFWGLREASADEKLSGELVIKSGSFVPKDVREMFLLFTPTEDNVACLAGSVNRNYINGETAGTQENPLAGDTVIVTASDCVVSSSEAEESSLLSGTWQMDVTQSTLNDYGWTTTLTDLVREFRLCEGELGCQAEDSETDNAVFQVLAQTVAIENAVAPFGTSKQTDIAVTFTSYISVERENVGESEPMLVETATITIDPATSLVVTDWSDEAGPLAFRLNGSAGISAREPEAQTDFVDIDLVIEANGLRQDVDQFSNLLNPEGQVSLTATIFDIAPIAADSGLEINYIPTIVGDIDVLMDTNASQQGGVDFVFSTTDQEVREADECDLSNDPCGPAP